MHALLFFLKKKTQMHISLSTEESTDAYITIYWWKHRCMNFYLLKKAQMHELLSTEESTDACIAIYWRKHRCMNCYLLKKAQMPALLSTEESTDAWIVIYWRKHRCIAICDTDACTATYWSTNCMLIYILLSCVESSYMYCYILKKAQVYALLPVTQKCHRRHICMYCYLL